MEECCLTENAACCVSERGVHALVGGFCSSPREGLPVRSVRTLLLAVRECMEYIDF
jgi:hypothetical protein